jgi:hypothetical protein
MNLAEMAHKIGTIDQFRKLAANQEIDPEDADTLKHIIRDWETDCVRNFLNLPADEHHFRAIKLALTLADLLLPDIEDEDIAENLVEVVTDFQQSIERMRQTIPEPDISGVVAEAIAEVRSETGT